MISFTVISRILGLKNSFRVSLGHIKKEMLKQNNEKVYETCISTCICFNFLQTYCVNIVIKWLSPGAGVLTCNVYVHM